MEDFDVNSSPRMLAEMIQVSNFEIIVTMTPLACLAWVSWMMGMKIEIPMITGTLRCYIQLSCLSLILMPIFSLGVRHWYVVIGYATFMVFMASMEATSRAKYYFPGMYWLVLATMIVNVTLVAGYVFLAILRPKPLWDPHYTIPITGMLLGNTINGTALALNAMLTSMVESAREIELLLSFGANQFEASERLVRDAVRTAAMPQLNAMAIIGIITIPGMMTGQMLAGAPVAQAARYQILMNYLIAICSFGAVLAQVFVTVRNSFDGTHMLRTDRLKRREGKRSLLKVGADLYHGSMAFCKRRYWRISPTAVEHADQPETEDLASDGHLELSSGSEDGDSAEGLDAVHKGQLTLSPLRRVADGHLHFFQILNLSCSFEHSHDSELPKRRILFQNLAFDVGAGDIASASGPSGVGKTTLLRILAGLSPCDSGDVVLDGIRRSDYDDMTLWRQRVRYVAQSKVEIPGTPQDFLKQISSLHVWKRNDVPSFSEMYTTASRFIQSWGMSPTYLDAEWSTLSGGEAQRILVAFAMASRPQVLLFDESTSALDFETKLKVEKSIEKFCEEQGISAFWITHDLDQVERMRKSDKTSLQVDEATDRE